MSGDFYINFLLVYRQGSCMIYYPKLCYPSRPHGLPLQRESSRQKNTRHEGQFLKFFTIPFHVPNSVNIFLLSKTPSVTFRTAYWNICTFFFFFFFFNCLPCFARLALLLPLTGEGGGKDDGVTGSSKPGGIKTSSITWRMPEGKKQNQSYKHHEVCSSKNTTRTHHCLR